MKKYILMITMLCLSTSAFAGGDNLDGSNGSQVQTDEDFTQMSEEGVEKRPTCTFKAACASLSNGWNQFANNCFKVGSAITDSACQFGSAVQEKGAKVLKRGYKVGSEIASDIKASLPSKKTVKSVVSYVSKAWDGALIGLTALSIRKNCRYVGDPAMIALGIKHIAPMITNNVAKCLVAGPLLLGAGVLTADSFAGLDFMYRYCR